MKNFLKEKIFSPANLSQIIKSVFQTGNNNYNKKNEAASVGKAEQIKKSILQVELIYNELKSDY